MDSRTLSLAQLLTNEVRYTVPLFQRKYVWEKDANWWPLWTSVVETASQLLADPSLTRPHFLGAIVHEGLPTRAGEIAEQRVIDGQQRLTTLQLLLAALRSAARDRGFVDTAARAERMIFNPDDVVRHGYDRYKVWPTNTDRGAFSAAIDGAPDSSLIGRAYQFFKERVSAFVDAGDGGDGPKPDPADEFSGPTISAEAEAATPAERAKALADALRDLIRVVVIELTPTEDDAQGIYETLNYHGADLLASELVKNHMFNRAQVAGLKVEDIYNANWLPLDGDWFSAHDFIGKKKRQRLDLAIGYWAAATSPRSADTVATHLFATVQEIARQRSGPMSRPDPAGVAGLFEEIHTYAETFRRLRVAAYTSVPGRFMSHLRDLSTTTPMPLVVWMAADPARVPSDQFEQALLTIESYLVRRAACGLSNKNYNRIFSSILTATKREPEKAGDVVTRALLAFHEDTSRWPDDQEFSHALIHMPQYNRNLRSTRVRMVLQAIEMAMRGPDVEALVPPGVRSEDLVTPGGPGTTLTGAPLTVEHVMPQNWLENWPIPDGRDRRTETNNRNDHLHRLGNLTLVTGAKNAKMSNAPWSVKRGYLRTSSLLMLTHGTVLAVPYPPGKARAHGEKAQQADEAFANQWELDPALVIELRGSVLAAWAKHIWSRPPTDDE